MPYRTFLTHLNGSRFLWVAFQVEDICRQVCDRDIRETIRKLPKNLPETYNRILSRIDKLGNAKLAKKIFPWVAAARRPMLLEELREALSVEPLQLYSDPERLVNDMGQIVSWCGNLIVLDEQDGTVQFTHKTVKIFLLDSFWDQTNEDFHFEQREIDYHAGEICVTYLNFNDFKTKLIRQPKEIPLPTPELILRTSLSVGSNSTSKSIWKKVARLRGHRKGYNPNSTHVFHGATMHNGFGAVRELQREHPFVSYAAEYWLHHSANFTRTEVRIWRLWERLLLSENGPAAMPWECSEWSQRTTTIRRWICNQEHVALLSVIESSETPFVEAEMQCIMEFAIERPSPNLLDTVLRECHSLTKVLNESFVVAAGGGHLWATNRLLAEEVDPNWRASNSQSKKHMGLTALQAAAKGGYLEVIDELVTTKADVNAGPADDSGRTALQAAAENGHLEVVERLIIARADVNAGGAKYNGRTALQAAAGAGHLEVIERLLIAKANVNARTSEFDGRTALQAAAEAGHLEVVEKLLSAKANVNSGPADHKGRTALQAAAENGHVEVVERLLTAKADVDARAAENSGRTALQAAAGAGHLEVVKRLLAAKANVNAGAARYIGRTALQAAAENGHLEVVNRLLTAKADVNARAAENSGRTALQAAAATGHLEVVERLLTLKANVNARAAQYTGRIALEAAAENGHLEVVERLLTAKADVNAEAELNGRTALQAAAEAGHFEVVERLLKEKVAHEDIRAALRVAQQTGDERLIKSLKSAVTMS